MFDILHISSEIGLMLPLMMTILVPVMAWCSQATNYYQKERWWPSLMSPYGITRGRWIHFHRCIPHSQGCQIWYIWCDCTMTVKCAKYYNNTILYMRRAMPKNIKTTGLNIHPDTGFEWQIQDLCLLSTYHPRHGIRAKMRQFGKIKVTHLKAHLYPTTCACIFVKGLISSMENWIKLVIQ